MSLSFHPPSLSILTLWLPWACHFNVYVLSGGLLITPEQVHLTLGASEHGQACVTTVLWLQQLEPLMYTILIVTHGQHIWNWSDSKSLLVVYLVIYHICLFTYLMQHLSQRCLKLSKYIKIWYMAHQGQMIPSCDKDMPYLQLVVRRKQRNKR